MGLELSDVFVTLEDRKAWRKARTQDELVREMEARLSGLPGMRVIFTQPIEMRVNEMVAGIRAEAIVTAPRIVAMLRREGVRYSRIKLLPVFRTGKLEDPASGSVVTEAMMSGVEPGFLQCSETRVVTTQGIYACPILVGKREGFLYEGSLRPSSSVLLAHHACRTCYETGMSCANL